MNNTISVQRDIEPRGFVEQKRVSEKRRAAEARKRRKLRNQIIFIAWQVIFLAIVLFLYLDIKIQLREVREAFSGNEAVDIEKAVKTDEQDLPSVYRNNVSADYVSMYGLDTVDRPVERSPRQVHDRLQELAQDHDMIGEILKDTTLYPDELLEALANNPEMAAFVAGYPDAEGAAAGALTEAEKSEDYPLFLQWDPRWGYASYGDNSIIGLAGCGPTSLSMVLYYLTGDEMLTPDKLAEYSMENGYYMSGTGTAWSLMKEVPGLYGVKVKQPGISEQAMKKELDQGNILICSMREGDFTTAGHFIVIYGYDEDGFKVNDANCVARSRQSWPFSQIGSQIKSVWSYGK